MRPGPPESRLFDSEALHVAKEQHDESHFRWLSLSEDPEAMNMRRVLEHCWTLAGRSRTVLRKGLLHERWGQHAGALAHLLSLGLFAREGFAVECEPDLGKQSPDLLVSQGDDRVLVEVRSITGCGTSPWESPPDPQAVLATRRRDELRKRGKRDGRRRNASPDGRPLSAAAAEKEARARARKLAAERAKAEQALKEDLRDVVVRVLERKAAAYKALCSREDLPYIICLYQDTDTQIPPIVCDWAFGRGGRELDPDGVWQSTHDPADGVFHGDRWHFGHVSGVIVFGRVDDEEGRLFMRGDLVVNPYATRPLPGSGRFPHLRCYRLRTNVTPPRMRWTPHDVPPFEIVPHP